MDAGSSFRNPMKHNVFVNLATMAAIAMLAAGCAAGRFRLPEGTANPDKYLFDRGTAQLNDKKWLTARDYYRHLVDNYPQSPYRADAKLGLGDSYLGEGTTEAYIQAIGEFREFLTFFPIHARADYAQYKLGLAHFYQMRGPERDQTETKEAVREFETFIDRFPNRPLTPEVRAKLREARDRMGDSDYRVGYFYFRSRWYPGAVDRLKALLKSDPQYSRRDAAYFYLAEALLKLNLGAEALPYYERLVAEFERSEHLADAQKRIAELKAPKPPVTPTTQK